MNSLVPCPGCARHVRVGESACPFCSAGLSSAMADAVIPAAPARMKRAALFAFAATISVAGCGDSTPSGYDSGVVADAGGATDSGRPATDSGAPATDSGRPATDAGTAVADSGGGPSDAGGIAPLYGAPADDAGPPVDSGGGGLRYGAPPPPDDWA